MYQSEETGSSEGVPHSDGLVSRARDDEWTWGWASFLRLTHTHTEQREREREGTSHDAWPELTLDD